MALTGTEVVDVLGVQSNGSPSSVLEPTTTGAIAALSVASRGTFVANGATAVTVAYTGMTRTRAITVSLNTVGGAVGAQPVVNTVTPGTGFTVVATAGDTSTYNWIAE